MRLTFLPVSLLCLVLCLGLAHPSLGQRTLAVQWDIPEDRETALHQLETFRNLDIHLIEISEQPEKEIWNRINELEFSVYGHLSLTFPLVQTFANPDSLLVEDLRKSLDLFITQPSLQALGLFKYGAIYQPGFDTAIRPFVEEIRNSFDGQLYYTMVRKNDSPADEYFDFKMLEVKVKAQQNFSVGDSLSPEVGGIAYRPEAEISSYLRPFHTFLEEHKGKYESTPIFVSSRWLLPMLEKYPDFAQTVRLYNSDSEFVFPVPREASNLTATNSLIVLLLILIWCILAVNYHMSPVFRKSSMRYFLAHVFFVEDVMNRHIRSVGASLTILVVNMLLAGITVYCVTKVTFSPLGLEAVIFYYPKIILLQPPMLSLFLWGFVLAGILTVTSIIWIKLSNKAIRSFRQVLNLYTWPLQINFILATVMVTLLMAGPYPAMTLLLAILFSAVHISAFIITAVDTAKYMASHKALFLMGSIGIYLLIWMGLGYWLLVSNIPDVIQLAAQL